MGTVTATYSVRCALPLFICSSDCYYKIDQYISDINFVLILFWFSHFYHFISQSNAYYTINHYFIVKTKVLTSVNEFDPTTQILVPVKVNTFSVKKRETLAISHIVHDYLLPLLWDWTTEFMNEFCKKKVVTVLPVCYSVTKSILHLSIELWSKTQGNWLYDSGQKAQVELTLRQNSLFPAGLLPRRCLNIEKPAVLKTKLLRIAPEPYVWVYRSFFFFWGGGFVFG